MRNPPLMKFYKNKIKREGDAADETGCRLCKWCVFVYVYETAREQSAALFPRACCPRISGPAECVVVVCVCSAPPTDAGRESGEQNDLTPVTS